MKIPGPLLRIEARLKRLNAAACDLQSVLKNPFASLEICQNHSAVKLWKDQPWLAFVSACAYDGANKCLSQQTKADRKKYMNRLRSTPAFWWSPEKLWKGLPEALQAIAP